MWKLNNVEYYTVGVCKNVLIILKLILYYRFEAKFINVGTCKFSIPLHGQKVKVVKAFNTTKQNEKNFQLFRIHKTPAAMVYIR